VSNVSAVTNNIRRHFDDLKIVRRDFEQPYFSLFRLLLSTAPLSKAENIQPMMAAEMMRGILLGTPYPISVLLAVVGRVRAEQSKKDRCLPEAQGQKLCWSDKG
jgi:CRISPR-associated protein Csd1